MLRSNTVLCKQLFGSDGEEPAEAPKWQGGLFAKVVLRMS